MAKLPSERDLGGLPGVRGRGVARINTTGEARGALAIANAQGAGARQVNQATQQLAQSITGVGTAMQEHEAKRDQFELAKADADYLIGRQSANNDLANDTDMDGMEDRYTKRFGEVRSNAAGQITNDRNRQLWETKRSPNFASSQLDVQNRSLSLLKDQDIATTNEQLQQLSNSTFANEESVRSEHVNTATSLIDSMKEQGHISAVQAQDLKSKWVKDYSLSQIQQMSPEDQVRALSKDKGVASFIDPVVRKKMLSAAVEMRGKKMIADDPRLARLVAETGVTPGFVGKIINVESGGKANAKNKLSTATGAGQFIEDTWKEFMREMHPEEKGNILKLRGNKDLSKEAVAWYARKNAKLLSASNLPVNDTTVYLAHFLGSGYGAKSKGAIDVLKADPSTAVSSILSSKVMAANPNLKGKTAGQVVDWASRKMTGANADVSFPAAERIKRFAEGEIRDQNARISAEYKSYKGDMELGIATDTVDENNIKEDGILKAEDKAIMLGKVRARRKQVGLEDSVASVLSGGGGVNIYDTDQRKALDTHYRRAIEQAPEGEKEDAARNIIEKSQYAPDSLVKDIRTGLISEDDETAISALNLGAFALSVNQNAFSGRGGESEVLKSVDVFSAYIKQGYSEEEAFARWRTVSDPEAMARRQSTLKDPETKKWLKAQSTPSKVGAVFETEGALWNFDTEFVSDSHGLQIAAEYQDYLSDALVDSGGDRESAQALAATRMSRVYGNSDMNIGGKTVLMRLPPEKYYPPVAGSHEYIKEQVGEFVDSLEGVEINRDNVFLQPDEETEKDIQSGKLPRYQVWYFDKDNRMQMVGGGHFQADIEQANKSRLSKLKASNRAIAKQKDTAAFRKLIN